MILRLLTFDPPNSLVIPMYNLKESVLSVYIIDAQSGKKYNYSVYKDNQLNPKLTCFSSYD